MNQLEKLTVEYLREETIKTEFTEEEAVFISIVGAAYMAGFRKAREMAADLGLEDYDPRFIREKLEQLGEVKK